jgi:RNA polymerase sigma-70 factor (ECF subfamily)
MTASGEMISADLVNRLRAMVARRLADRAEIDDVVQEVLIKIVRDGDAVSPNRFWGWLKQVIYTTISDVYRARSSRGTFAAAPAELEAIVDESLAQEGEPDEHPLSCCLPAFLNQLRDEERELLHAVDIEGTAQRDLAAARKLSYSTLKSRVQKARVSLKRQIIACCDVSFDARHQVVDADPRGGGCGADRRSGQCGPSFDLKHARTATHTWG